MRPPARARRWALLLLLLLLLLLAPLRAAGRRGAPGRSSAPGGLRGGFRAVSRAGSAPGRGSRVAGAIAAGAAAGYGVGLLGRPRPARLGHGVPAARGFHGAWPELGAKRGAPSRAPAPRRAAPGLVLLLAWAACLVSRGMQR